MTCPNKRRDNLTSLVTAQQLHEKLEALEARLDQNDRNALIALVLVILVCAALALWR